MKNGLIYRFLMRWLVCSLGLWIAAGLFKNHITLNGDLHVVIVAGLVLALVNSVLKPLVVILSLPAILFSLGLFMIIINGFMVFVASKFYEPLHVANFWVAILAGMIIGLVNYLVTTILENRES